MKRPKLSRPVSCCCAYAAVLAAPVVLLWPVFGVDKERPEGAACMSNMKQMSTGLNMYYQDYERMPPGLQWMDSISPYVRNDVFRCPIVTRDYPAGYGYAYNGRLSKKRAKDIGEPKDALLLFESDTLSRSAFGPATNVADPPRHNGRNNVSFLDGHVKQISNDAISASPRMNK